MNDPATGAMVLIMQRLHELDPTGYLLEQEPGVWTLVRIPLEAETDERWVFPLSGRVVERKREEVLQPERVSTGHRRAVEGTALELGRPVSAATESDRRKFDQQPQICRLRSASAC